METSLSLPEEMGKHTHGWGQAMLGNTVTFRPPTVCPGYPEQAGHSIPDFVLIYSTSFCSFRISLTSFHLPYTFNIFLLSLFISFSHLHIQPIIQYHYSYWPDTAHVPLPLKQWCQSTRRCILENYNLLSLF